MNTTSGAQQSGERVRSSLTAAMGYGGWQATILSGFALLISAYSLYESTFKTADIEVYIPPVIQYARDGGGDTELFALPITVTNSGARTGTILSMQLAVENLKTKRTKNYYSAFRGEHQINPDATNRAFAPISIAGRETFSDTVRFYPVGNPLPKLIDDAGDYRFTLSLVTAAPKQPDLIDRVLGSKPAPVVFERTLPWMSDQQLDYRRIAISMPERGWTAQGEKKATTDSAGETATTVPQQAAEEPAKPQ